MLKGIFQAIFLFISIISLIEAHFDFKLGYCRFKCVDPCKEEKEADNPLGGAKKPSAYYWRDFYGEIPSDAYPLGNSNQIPQTYIGLVFVPSKNGTFVTTIVEGLDHVYVVNQTVVKKNLGNTTQIQILCTMEPQRFVWFKLSPVSYATIDQTVFEIVTGSYQQILIDDYQKPFRQYIAKIPYCGVYYGGCMREFDDKMEYALLDGTPMKTESPLWLFYRKKTKEENGAQNKARSFISHRYEYNIRTDSIIPSFYKQFTFGDCSMTCTNEGSGKKGKALQGAETQATAAMEYYWQPSNVFNPEEAVKVGELFIGQTYCGSYNWYDVGRSMDGQYVYIDGERISYLEMLATQMMCSNRPESFEWVNTTSTTIDHIDQSRMIPGGAMDNGTQTFVGRVVGKIGDDVGSVRIFGKSAFIYSTFAGTKDDFRVLMYKDSRKQKQS